MKTKLLLSFFLLLPLTIISAQDLSGEKDITISIEPRLAHVNITGIETMPETKEENKKAWFEYRDENGVTFRKRIIINAQGNSSLALPKKNFTADFCEDEWIGEETTDITIGKWVAQDSFHFKAYWYDTFRGGVAAAMGYKLYEDIVADEPRIQERAGLSDFDRNAICHPDCFPCIVSLNGEFLGVFSWQLKKHRKNLSMEKKNSKHVYFELTNYTESLATGIVNWNDIEVKNPKTLTDEAKGYIEKYARYHLDLDAMEREGNADMRQEIEKRYDVASFIDYIIHNLITANADGAGKNVQYFTYDGEKWFCTPYDLDLTFGTLWVNDFQFPAEWTWMREDYTMPTATKGYIPFYWFSKYFWEEIKARYATLRTSGVLSTDSIIRHLIDWNERVGQDYFAKEKERWSASPCFGHREVNKEWESIESWEDYYATPKYDAEKEYKAGDRCVYNYHIYEAKENVSGITPTATGGYTDTEERVRTWLDRRIELEDDYLEYVAPKDSVSAETRKFIRGNRILIHHNGHYYTPDGAEVCGGF